MSGDRDQPRMAVSGDPDASVGARHHRVPRFYLERFANERMQITTVDRRTRARRTAAIRETAAEKDFYTAINTQGVKDGKTERSPCTSGTAAAAQVMTGASPMPTRSGPPSTRVGCSS